jgi:hypothetical protein
MSNKDEVKKDIQKFSAIDAISSTVGGKIVVKNLQKDIVSTIDELCSKYKTTPHIEMIALCSRLSERLTLLRVLTKAKKLKKLAQEEMEFLLKEEE